MEKCEQQQHGNGVQQHVAEMMPSARHAEKPVIEHVGEARERKPIGRVARGEGPGDIRRGEPAAHVGIGGDVVGIVEIDEVETDGLRAAREGSGEQQGVDPESRFILGARPQPCASCLRHPAKLPASRERDIQCEYTAWRLPAAKSIASRPTPRESWRAWKHSPIGIPPMSARTSRYRWWASAASGCTRRNSSSAARSWESCRECSPRWRRRVSNLYWESPRLRAGSPLGFLPCRGWRCQLPD